MQAAPASVDQLVSVDAKVPPERDHRLFWWKEALIAVVFYAVYSWTRNQFGSNRVGGDLVPLHAFNNARRVIRFERLVGLFHEESIQEWFLSQRWLIQAMNVFYGTAHFVVTLGVFLLLYLKRKDVFPQWRNTLAVMTALAIVGFALFPLMPPRLLDAPCADYGGACIGSGLRPEGGTFGFVDTLAVYGGPWSFDSEGMADISNQYAAMPSLHIGWATWSAIALWPLHPSLVAAGGGARLPAADHAGHHRHRQPLLDRRSGWARHLRRRGDRRLGDPPLEPGPPRPGLGTRARLDRRVGATRTVLK